MAKYQPQIDLWWNGVQEKILSGEIPMQRGQWLHCGGNPCIYIGKTENTIHVAHGHTREAALKEFHRKLDGLKEVEQRLAARKARKAA